MKIAGGRFLGCASRFWQVLTSVGAAPYGRPAFDVTIGPRAVAQDPNNGRAATWGRPYEAKRPWPENLGTGFLAPRELDSDGSLRVTSAAIPGEGVRACPEPVEGSPKT